MFRKLLIANRGEIACRVIATARRLGIATVAVYSAADARARHVELAEEAYPIGSAPARESYLSAERIIEAACKSGAEAVHPGYGFLSENADFAEACTRTGIVFVGPPASAIRAMGSKAAAKALMQRSGVPLVPGYHDKAQDSFTLADAAQRIGYPVLLKASAGGGGRGMRVVSSADELEAAIAGAKRESKQAFGDDRLLIEKYLTRPRHIEIQIFADAHGNFVSLFERDCSIQRRHQKVIEEAPAPGMDAARRQAMGDAAIAAARAVGYVNAGTVEFIAEGERFYFMEMNTRLQVEHPVTEMITGQDLVEWQLRVAAGEKLPLTQEQLGIRGHAIEARIYAEDPARDFRPSTGTLVHLRQPREGLAVRVDAGVREGDAISPHYDAMIAKLIVWGEDRDAAITRLRAALGEYEAAGVKTNLRLLRAIGAHPAYAAAEIDTGFIARHGLTAGEQRPAEPAVLAAAVLKMLADMQGPRVEAADPCSPWNAADAWRMNGDGYQDLQLQAGEQVVPIRAHPQPDGSFVLDLPSGAVTARREAGWLSLDGVRLPVNVVRSSDALTVIVHGENHVLHYVDPLAPPRAESGGDDRLTAPIPARVARVLVKAGDKVKKGAPLIVLEAMKMEMTLTAPMDGTIAVVRHVAEEMVEEGVELITFALA
jgi:3-methylcrotonyl-CoA carboxylase alpha subunit